MASHAALLQTVSIDLNASVAYLSNVTVLVTLLHLTLSCFFRKQVCVIARAERDGTRAETIFRLSPKRTSPFKSVGGRQFSRLLAAEVAHQLE